MDKGLDVLGNVINFLLVSLVFIGILALIFKITLKNYSVKTSKIKFYGLFLGMDTRSILAFSIITLNYIFLIWCTATFSGLNIIYVFITLLLVLLADILTKDYKRMAYDLMFCMINIACIFVTSMLYNYLTTKYTTIFLLILLGLVIVFVFLYFTYATFKMLNNVVIKQENLKKKNYKKI